ncbi:MAG: hypothetical protein ABW189_06650 [Rickettsiales bacterium]
MEFTAAHINALLAQEDVEGFIEAGAPIDEYIDEAAQIAAALLLLHRNELTDEIMLSTLSLIWMRSFELSEHDMALRLPALERIAVKIIA